MLRPATGSLTKATTWARRCGVYDAEGDGVALYKLASAHVYAARTAAGPDAEALYDAAVTAAREVGQLVPDDLEAAHGARAGVGTSGAVPGRAGVP